MMALKAPFADCASYASVITAVLHAEAPQSPGGYSDELSAALQALLAQNPDERPTNAHLLAGGLLQPTFNAVLRMVAEGVPKRGTSGTPAKSSSAPLSVPDSERDDTSYKSDFESYSGSESPSNHGDLPFGECRSMSAGGWSEVFAEADALLNVGTEVSADERINKVRSALCN